MIVITFWEFIVVVCAYYQENRAIDDYLADYLPLNTGFMNALGIDDRMATILSLPALFISVAIYIFGYGKQICALSHSRLLPSFLGWTLPRSKIPYMSLITGSLIGLFLLLLLVKALDLSYDSSVMNDSFNAALMGSYFNFMVMFVSYIIFRIKYINLKRHFRNPLGIYGAIYGMISLTFIFIALMGFTSDTFGGFIYFLCFISICTIYYFTYARYRQVYSMEEQNVLFVVYLMKGVEFPFCFSFSYEFLFW